MTIAPLAKIADELHTRILAMHPFTATEDGLAGYAAQVPDLSAATARAYRTELDAIRGRAESSGASSLSEHVTLDAIGHTVERELAFLQHGGIEHTVSTILAEGPSAVLTQASRARPTDPDAAQDYLELCAGFATYLDTHAARLAEGTRQGRFPVAALVGVALSQVEEYLARDHPDVIADVPPPRDWASGARWQRQVRDLARGTVRPAMQRWRDAVARLPTRSNAQCGLVHVPGGMQDYRALVRAHTTLPAEPQRLHEAGREQVAALTDEITELGAAIGLQGFTAVMRAFLASSAAARAESLPAAFRRALQRAETALTGIVTAPLPPRCAIAAMPEHLGETGHAPHYTSPRLDGTREGTFWYNAQQPAAGGGWSLAALTYHESVPGHHLQVARAQTRYELPELQRHGFITAHGEGWALYAELLAGELGLYANTEERIGALTLRMFRAARLVLDTGIHALGWTLDEATDWLTRTVPVPRDFAAAEIRRYVGAPAQALGYTTGLMEILRLREAARRGLGERFDLREFHNVILDSGSVPLHSLQLLVDHWAGTSGADEGSGLPGESDARV